MTTHIMIDLETLATEPGAAILSIGAVTFDAGIPRIAVFDAAIDFGSASGAINADTLRWWMRQSDDARSAAFERKTMTEREALMAFSRWVQAQHASRTLGAAPGQGGPLCLWGNGAGFDQPILAAAYRRHDLPLPWKYSGERCYRTLRALYPVVEPGPRIGTHHNALDDALHQAEHASRILTRATQGIGT